MKYECSTHGSVVPKFDGDGKSWCRCGLAAPVSAPPKRMYGKAKTQPATKKASKAESSTKEVKNQDA